MIAADEGYIAVTCIWTGGNSQGAKLQGSTPVLHVLCSLTVIVLIANPDEIANMAWLTQTSSHADDGAKALCSNAECWAERRSRECPVAGTVASFEPALPHAPRKHMQSVA